MQSDMKKYVCPDPGCTSAFNRPYRLTQHRLRHTLIKPFACEEANCSKVYTSKSHLNRHVNSVHKQTTVDILYCCPICMKNYSNRQNLKRHLNRNHKNIKKTSYTCHYCSVLFKKKHQIKAHMYHHTGVKAFKCSICHKEFVTRADREKHKRNHKVYSCHHCDRKFNLWADLLTHKKIDHYTPEFICNDCGKTFKDRLQIIRHVKIHMPVAVVPVYFCPHENCQRHYTRSNNLKQHILLAHGSQTFKCTMCGAHLSSKAKLKDHTERHSRPGVIVRNPMTRENGRKTRKDVNTVKVTSAMKLAGIHDEDEDTRTQISNSHSTDNNNLCDNLDET